MRLKHAGMLAAIADRAVCSMSAFSTNQIADLVWGYAMLSEKNGPLLSAASKQFTQQIHCAESDALVLVAWSYAHLGARQDALMTSTASEFARKTGVRRHSLADLARVFDACLEAGVLHKPLAQEVAKACTADNLRKLSRPKFCQLVSSLKEYCNKRGTKDFPKTFADLNEEQQRRKIRDAALNADWLDPKHWLPRNKRKIGILLQSRS